MRKHLAVPDRKSITETTPLRLDVAAAIAFPDGSLGKSGLRREIDKGNLAASLIAGKFYTTLRDIHEMIERCRVAPISDRGAEAGALAVRRSRQEDQRSRIQEQEARAAGFNSVRELARAALMQELAKKR